VKQGRGLRRGSTSEIKASFPTRGGTMGAGVGYLSGVQDKGPVAGRNLAFKFGNQSHAHLIVRRLLLGSLSMELELFHLGPC
jgi:hypothetical protein